MTVVFLIIRRFILLLPGETGRLPTKAASSARDRVPDPSASIAATSARTSAGEASRFVILRPVRNISSTSWTDNSPDRSRSYLRKNRSSGREPHLALNAFRNLSCVFMSRGFLTVRLKRCVARLAEVARRMVVWLLLVSCLLVSRGWVGRGGGVRTPVGRGQPCGARGSPLPGQKGRWAALCKGDAVGLSPDARWGRVLSGTQTRPLRRVATGICRNGAGWVCWKRRFSGLPTFDARRGLVGRGDVRGVCSARDAGATRDPPTSRSVCSRRPGAQLIRCKSPNFRPTLRPST